jgi:hypothetical protein
MATTALVAPNVDAGAALVNLLDDREIPVSAALWIRMDAEREWELVLSSREVDRHGSLNVYKRIAKLLQANPIDGISLDHVRLVGERHPLVALLRRVVKTGAKRLSQIRFTRNVVDGTFIEDAVIYRMP